MIFIFATTETQKVPATILSRCQCFDFRRIPLKHIAENSAEDRRGRRDPDQRHGACLDCRGGGREPPRLPEHLRPGDLLCRVRDRGYGGRGDPRPVGPALPLSLSEAVLARDAGRCLKIIDEAYYAGLDMKFFYQTLLGHFRNLLLAISGDAGEGPSSIFRRKNGTNSRRSGGASRETLQRYLEILMAEEENVRRSQNPRLNLEAVLCRMAYLEPLIPIEEVLARMEGLERRLGGGTSAGRAAPEVKRAVGKRGGAGSREYRRVANKCISGGGGAARRRERYDCRRNRREPPPISGGGARS